MNRIAILATAAALVVGCAAPKETASLEVTPAVSSGPLEAGAKAPNFSLQGTDGKTHTLASVTAKGPAFVFFMKHNCSANPDAVPLMTAISNAYGDKVPFYAVTTGDDEQAKSEGAQYGFKPVQLLDKSQTLIGAFGLEKSQHTYLVAKDGTISEAFHGYGKEALNRLNAAMAAAAKVAVAKVDLSAAPDRVAYG